MAILTTDFPKHLTTGTKEYNDIFKNYLEGVDTPIYDILMNVDFTEGQKWDKTKVAMSDLPRIPERGGPTDDMEELKYDEEWKETLTVSEYAGQFKVPYLHWIALAASDRAAFPQLFAESAAETCDYLASALYRNAFTDSGPDGVSLCNDSHTMPTGGTWDNKGTAALSQSAISAAVASMARIVTPQGKVQRGFRPNLLVTPPDLTADALELTGAKMLGDYSSRVSDANPVQKLALTHVEHPFLSETNDWFLQLRPERVPNGPTVLFQVAPDFSSGFNDETKKHWGNTDFSLGVGYFTPRFIWGSTGGS